MSGEIGEALRQAREARGVEIERIAEATKIRPRYLRALESERWELLPGRAYVRGFLRTYAAHLDLDPEPLVERLERELADAGAEGELPPEPIVEPGTLPTGLRAIGWRRVVATALGVAAIAAGVALVATSAGDGENGEPPAAPDPATERMEEPPEPDPEPEPDPGDEPDPPERASLRLAATAAVWVCVVDGRGEALVAGETLAAGEERGPLTARRLRITLGNGAVEARANGEPVEVPDAAEPIGLEVTADGAEELPPEEHPTCS